MANDNWSMDDNIGTIVEADGHRAEVNIQHYAGNDVYLGVGEVPEVGKGIKLFTGNRIAVFTGDDAMKKITAICASGESATGGVRVR